MPGANPAPADDAGGDECGREAWFGVEPTRRHPAGLKVCGRCLGKVVRESKGKVRHWQLGLPTYLP